MKAGTIGECRVSALGHIGIRPSSFEEATGTAQLLDSLLDGTAERLLDLGRCLRADDTFSR